MSFPNVGPSNSGNQSFWNRETLQQLKYKLGYGALLSAGVAVGTAPLDYVKNMVMHGSKPRLRDCFRGVLLTAMNDIPAASITISTDYLAKRYFQRSNGGAPMTLVQQVVSACFAGGLSGLCITPGQMVVLNYQNRVKTNVKVLSMPEIFYEAYRQGGIRRLFIGAEFMIAREIKYSLTYLVLAEMIANYSRRFFKSEEGSVAFGAFTSGAIAGGVSTPADFLRVEKQKQALSGKAILSNLEIYRSLSSPRVLFTGMLPRIVAISFAVFGIVEGRRHLFPSLLED